VLLAIGETNSIATRRYTTALGTSATTKNLRSGSTQGSAPTIFTVASTSRALGAGRCDGEDGRGSSGFCTKEQLKIRSLQRARTRCVSGWLAGNWRLYSRLLEIIGRSYLSRDGHPLSSLSRGFRS